MHYVDHYKWRTETCGEAGEVEPPPLHNAYPVQQGSCSISTCGSQTCNSVSMAAVPTALVTVTTVTVAAVPVAAVAVAAAHAAAVSMGKARQPHLFEMR
jgi:hypothetical protein